MKSDDELNTIRFIRALHFLPTMQQALPGETPTWVLDQVQTAEKVQSTLKV